MPVFRLQNQQVDFPSPLKANADGLVAVGGDLSVPRLLQAYRSGIFPWTADPITWWSPDPRAVLPLNGLHVSRSLARTLRKGEFKITLNTAFEEVIRECARSTPGRGKTWISPEFIDSYLQLHTNGHAHSIECWYGKTLAGGVYGVAVGGLFAGESMFHRENDASKVALCHLVAHLDQKRFKLFDIQMLTPVTRQLGGVELPRKEYLALLAEAVVKPCQF
jgi:leucyl/phenylalanyl-tRNA--protein transferase